MLRTNERGSSGRQVVGMIPLGFASGWDTRSAPSFSSRMIRRRSNGAGLSGTTLPREARTRARPTSYGVKPSETY